jgi:hypothetical protein
MMKCFNGAASLMDAETGPSGTGHRQAPGFNGAASLMDAETRSTCAIDHEGSRGFNGAASLMDAETQLRNSKTSLTLKLQWGRITDGCGNGPRSNA